MCRRRGTVRGCVLDGELFRGSRPQSLDNPAHRKFVFVHQHASINYDNVSGILAKNRGDVFVLKVI